MCACVEGGTVAASSAQSCAWAGGVGGVGWGDAPGPRPAHQSASALGPCQSAARGDGGGGGRAGARCACAGVRRAGGGALGLGQEPLSLPHRMPRSRAVRQRPRVGAVRQCARTPPPPFPLSHVCHDAQGQKVEGLLVVDEVGVQLGRALRSGQVQAAHVSASVDAGGGGGQRGVVRGVAGKACQVQPCQAPPTTTTTHPTHPPSHTHTRHTTHRSFSVRWRAGLEGGGWLMPPSPSRKPRLMRWAA